MAGAVISARQLFAAAMAAEAAGDRAGAERGYRRVAMAAPDNPVSARRGLAAAAGGRLRPPICAPGWFTAPTTGAPAWPGRSAGGL